MKEEEKWQVVISVQYDGQQVNDYPTQDNLTLEEALDGARDALDFVDDWVHLEELEYSIYPERLR